MRRIIPTIITAVLVLTVFVYGKDITHMTGVGTQSAEVVISLGQDLSAAQKKQVTDYFSVVMDIKNARFITVSNQEERTYLEGKIDERVIGTRAISCACVKINPGGQGIDVKTHNISWVTPFMYANALNTAGVNDAQAVVTAPFEVSGTAALTGIIKAFETATGSKLSEQAKQTANQEVAEASKLGQKVGQDKAGKFIYEVKTQVVEKKITDPEEIRRIIIQVSADLNIKLAEEDIQRIVDLMQNLNRLNINVNKLNEQLNRVQQGYENVKNEAGKARGFMQRLADLIRSLLEGLGIAI